MRKGASDALLGRTIANKFVIESLLGSGAMGAVYRARQTALDKVVAIKVLHGEHADDPQFAARFQREAKAASRLNHPNSMAVIDYGEEPDGLLYIAMEYLDGDNLLGLLKRDFPLPPARTADLLMQTLAALAVAHDMGVVHRDLKPENIMVLRGTDDDGNPADIVKVCDFGIAKITDSRAYKRDGDRVSEAPVTTAGFLVGTPEYMSPEQGKGEKLDSRSDLYSVGVILYQLLTNAVPFEAENAIGVVLKHITEEPTRPSLVNPNADRRLEAVCMRALRKAPAERFQTAREMRGDLRTALDGGRGTPTYTPAPLPPPTSVRVAVRDSLLASENAATMELVAPAVSSPHVVLDPQPKPTLTGTAAPIAGAPRRRRLAVFVAAVVATCAGVGSYAAFDRLRHGDDGAELARDLPLGSIGAAPSGTARFGAPRVDDPPHGVSNPSPSGSHHALLAVASAPSHSGAAPSAPAPSTSATPLAAEAPSASVASAPSTAPSASAAAPATSASAAADSFDADKAYGVVGLISATGAQEGGVRAALRGVNFSGCYKSALKRTSVRAVGQATLSLSIDASGQVRSAILQPSFALPADASRCIQSSAASVAVSKAQLDGAATAQVYLDFRIP
jgi:serine/threonine-protein kinase